MPDAILPMIPRLAIHPLRLAGNGVRWVFDRLLLWQQRAEERAQLASMDGRLLKDIGISRADVDHEVAKHPWQA